MNLSDLLSGDVIEALATSTGASKKDTSSVLANALPTLMKSMASNASTKEGAKSLEKALNDHTSDNITVHVRGGEIKCKWDREENVVYMTGPATTVFEGDV